MLKSLLCILTEHLLSNANFRRQHFRYGESIVIKSPEIFKLSLKFFKINTQLYTHFDVNTNLMPGVLYQTLKEKILKRFKTRALPQTVLLQNPY